MQHLSQRAAKDFLWATRACFSLGLSSWTETLDRLLALRDMCAPTNPSAVFAERLLKVEDWPTESNWECNHEPPAPQGSAKRDRSSVLAWRDADASAGGEEPPQWMYMVSSVSGLTEWEFHQYDDDPYPSVPHGHRRSNHKWKLDAYQGWIYERTRQAGREPRWKIVTLWNDPKFRDFSLDALEYYINHFPHHNDWRVANPMRLPRRR